MKITVEPDTNEEKSNISSVVYEDIYEFVIVGRGINNLRDYTIQHSHVADKFRLIGLLYEMIERLKNDSPNRG